MGLVELYSSYEWRDKWSALAQPIPEISAAVQYYCPKPQKKMHNPHKST